MKGVRLWRISDGVPIAYFPGDAIHSARVSPDGKSLAIGDYTDDRLTMVDIDRRLVRYSLPKSLKKGVAFSSDSARFAADHPDGTIYLYDATSGKVLNRLIGSPSNKLHAIAFSPDDRLLALADEDGVRLVSCRSGRELARIIDQTRTTEVTFTPDGRSLWGVCFRSPRHQLVRWSADLENTDRSSP
jgi:WD40 repeat protein